MADAGAGVVRFGERGAAVADLFRTSAASFTAGGKALAGAVDAALTDELREGGADVEDESTVGWWCWDSRAAS
jgi:hypothetical protein